MRILKIAILGFGNVGKAYGEFLIKYHEKIKSEYNTDIRVVAIATKTRGNIVANEGLNLREVLEDLADNGKFTREELLAEKSGEEIIKDVDFDLLVELTPLNVRDGQPAIGHMEVAFAGGKAVVTANKGPIAWAYDRLAQLADAAGVPFFFETTVMDGAPVFNMRDHCLRMAEVLEISGVLNTTTNFILGQLEEGVSFNEALEKGRVMGFVEADPSLDLEGWDGAVKITALANVLMGAAITPDQVERESIVGISGEDLRKAREKGETIKVVCKAWRDQNRQVLARVKPERVPLTEQLALVNGTTSAVSITTDLLGNLTIFENNPDIYQTAYGVFSDTLRVIKESI